MKVIDLKFRNTTFSVNASNVERVKKLAERFNKRIDKIVDNSNNVSESKLAFITALMVEDELDTLKEEFEKKEKNQNSQQDVTAQLLGETLNQVAAYLENLAQAIEK